MLPISAQSLLPQQRIKLLLHKLNVCKDGGTTVIGQDVHDEHVQPHGSQRQVMQLAKNLMRVFSLTGLGPLPGATGDSSMDVVEIFPGEVQPQCAASGDDTACGSWMITVLTLLLVISLGTFAYMAWKVYKWPGVAETEHYHLAVQVAELDTDQLFGLWFG